VRARLLAAGLGVTGLLGLALWTAPVARAQPEGDAPAAEEPPPPPAGPTAVYFAELEKLGLVDASTGSKQTLTRELDAAEQLLRDGAAADAAVALYTIVESPRYTDFSDFIEYQNAEYYLGVALHQAGATGGALAAFERVLRRGPEAPYYGPAHRRAVDLAIETRDFEGVLARVEALDRGGAPITPSAAGDRAYLRGRIAYIKGDFTAAEGALAQISRKSRLYSSALYLRGVIRTRRGQWKDAAAAMCEIADTPDDDRFTFVVDERYFTIKDLARLGLGRLAHELAEYDDAYYHYFQIPEDSVHLPDALFEAAWSMYQKRELGTARDLTAELDRTFPNSPVWPEAGLLAGFVELADCKFDDSRKHYEKLISELAPVVKELDRIRKNPDARGELFRRAVERWRSESTGARVDAGGKADLTARVLGLLRLDPSFLRLHDAVSGMRAAAGEAPGIARAWSGLARQARARKVGAVSGETTLAEDEAADAAAAEQDLVRLAAEIERARAELGRGKRAGTVPADVAAEEEVRLAGLAKKVSAARLRARALSDQADAALTADAPAGLRPLLDADVVAVRRLERNSQELLERLEKESETLSQRMVEKLYRDTKKVLDKARLGKVDAVIGQKRALDIKVQDLASGRFPAELHGKLWEQGLIGDDEELWPFEGEFWHDEYEGWR
jgi:tetratricopeptide (TPR) repeat protein